MADAVPSPFDDADVYDALLGSLDYGIAFYVDLARQSPGPVLEIACGSGRVTLPCLQTGADVDGLDSSVAMLAKCRQKAASQGYHPQLHHADMSDFRLNKSYARIFITFNSFVHNLTQEAQIACLRCCHDHLLPGGQLVFDTFFPSLEIIGAAQHTRVLEHETTDPATGHLLRLYDTRSFDRVRQIQHSINEIEVLRDGVHQQTHRSEVELRWCYKDEMALLLRIAGFSDWQIVGDFAGTPLTHEGQGMIVRANKA